VEHERKISKVKYQSLSLSILPSSKKVKYQSLSLSILPSSKKFNYDETQVVTTIM
jgi:hypothetical protein